MNSGTRTVVWLFVLLLVGHSLNAAEITVRRDGSGDFTNINDAVAAADTNDTILVGPGTYVEPFIDVLVSLVIRSEAGPDATIIDGRDTNRIFRFLEINTVEGFTFLDGYAVSYSGAGGAIVARQGATVLIEDCRFNSNTGSHGGALYVTHEGTEVTVRDCSFENNDSPTIGGAISVVLGATCNVENCEFHSNSAGVWGGTINVGAWSTINISQSLFASNTSGNVAGAIYMYTAMGTIETSTFRHNRSPGNTSGTLTIQDSPSVIISRNIIADDTDGYGIYYYEGVESPHSCNLFHNNAKGSIYGGNIALSEMVRDPLFCPAPADTLALGENSPALPSNNECGLLIGAYGVGCGPVSVDRNSWGLIKSMRKNQDSKRLRVR